MAVVREKYWSDQSLTGRTGDYGLDVDHVRLFSKPFKTCNRVVIRNIITFELQL